MGKVIKPVFLMSFGSVVWLLGAISYSPIHQVTERAGFVMNSVGFTVRSAYAGSGLTSSTSTSSTSASSTIECVSLVRLASREQEDADVEHEDADDEHRNADDEYLHADDEHRKASIAQMKGDYASALAHEAKAAKHETKAIKHETKAKDHEAKATEYEGKVVKIRSVTGNCSVLLVAGGALVRNVDGTPKTESGVWILVNAYQSIADMLAQRGGAGVLFDSVASGSGSLAISIINPTPDSSMLSYREIRGE